MTTTIALDSDWTPDGYRFTYESHGTDTWNSWAVPVFDRATLERFVSDHSDMLSMSEPGRIAGGVDLTYLELSSDYPREDGWTEPLWRNDDGTYTLDIGWTFLFVVSE